MKRSPRAAAASRSSSVTRSRDAGTALAGADRDARPLPEIHGVEVTTASARYLLAMKLLAMRFGEDDDDIRVLLTQTGIATADEALALMVQMYPHREPPLKTRLFLEEILPLADG
jgi:hypothetical protein